MIVPAVACTAVSIALTLFTARGVVTTVAALAAVVHAGIVFRTPRQIERAIRTYAPYALRSNPERLGLVESSVSSVVGTIVARSHRTSRSRRATLFLHGAAGSWTTWTPMLEAAAVDSIAVANPVLLDLPGWGDGVLSTEGEYNPIEAISSLVKASAESLGYTEWDLVGHSMGGFIALHMAATWPECVLSVAVISPTSWSVIDATEHPVRHFWRLPAFVMLWRVMQALAALGSGGLRVARAMDAVHLLRGAVSPLFRYPRQISQSVITALATEVRPRSFAAAVQLARGYDPTVRWANIDCPVRVVRGDHDVFATADDLTLIGAILPASQRTTLADTGHFANIERPHEVLAAFGYIAGPERK